MRYQALPRARHFPPLSRQEALKMGDRAQSSSLVRK